MQFRKTVFYILLLILLAVLAVGIVMNWREVKEFLGFADPGSPQVADYKGKPIEFQVGGRNLSVPPVFSQEMLNYLKREMTSGGEQVKVDRKGNRLPFGIP